MVITAGIDPGTNSYEIFVMEDGTKLFRKEIKTSKVIENPEIILETINDSNAMFIAGLSGYGLPVKKFSELTKEDLFLMTLTRSDKPSVGLRRVLEYITQNNKPNFFTIPGVIHLPTVPEWRKINKIDMGTADKVCSVVMAMDQLSQKMNLDYEGQDFVLLEAGSAFNAFIAVKGGKIVDGIGGTSGFISYRSISSIDAELVPLFRKADNDNIPKSIIFEGGLGSYIKDKELGNWKSAEEIDNKDILSWQLEYILKGLKVVEVSLRATDKEKPMVITSGSVFCNKLFKSMFKDRCGSYEILELKEIDTGGQSKKSGRGAAIIADGIAGGRYAQLIEKMELKNAMGTVLDYITLDIRRHIQV